MKVLPLVFASAVAAATLWRWGRVGWPGKLAGAALSGLLALYGAGAVHLPDLETLIGSIGSSLGPYTYVLVAVMAFLETGGFVGLLVPGETVVIAGGVVAGQGHIDVLTLFALTWICALGGDISGYLLGRRLGRRFLIEHGARVHITEARLVRVEGFFARYGLATILIGRFVGLVRPVAPFLAGASRYPSGRFAAVALVGTGLWSGAFVGLGYLFWQSFDEAVAIAKQGTLAVGAIALLLAAAIFARRLVRNRRAAPRDRPRGGHAKAVVAEPEGVS